MQVRVLPWGPFFERLLARWPWQVTRGSSPQAEAFNSLKRWSQQPCPLAAFQSTSRHPGASITILSSAGRAAPLQGEGRRFNPSRIDHFLIAFVVKLVDTVA